MSQPASQLQCGGGGGGACTMLFLCNKLGHDSEWKVIHSARSLLEARILQCLVTGGTENGLTLLGGCDC